MKAAEEEKFQLEEEEKRKEAEKKREEKRQQRMVCVLFNTKIPKVDYIKTQGVYDTSPLSKRVCSDLERAREAEKSRTGKGNATACEPALPQNPVTPSRPGAMETSTGAKPYQ